MSRIRALFFDLDGTLLNSRKVISDRTKTVLKQCRDAGILLFIATARPKTLDKMLPEWTEDTFALFDGGIFSNGACRMLDGKIEYTYIDAEAVHQCVEIVNASGYHLVLQMKDEVHAFNYEFNEEHIEEWGLQDRRIVPLSKECEHQTVKIMIYTRNLVDRTEKLPIELFETLKEKIGIHSHLYLTDEDEVIMMMSDSVSKYAAIEALREKLHLEKEEIAVFGDDANDIEMLSGYPNSVAMGNANDRIKSIGTYCTLSHDEEGVLYAIQHLLKLI